VTRTRVAAFTPGPPRRSGGAVYAGVLLPALAEHLDVVAVSPDVIDWDGPTVRPEDVNPADHDVMLHFLADSPDHLFSYRSAVELGGVVVCHDLMLPHLLGTFAPDDDAADLADHLGQDEARQLLDRRARGIASHTEVYLLQVVNRAVRRAKAAVVHSRFAKFVLESEVPGLPVHHVPSHTGAVPDDLPAGRGELGLPADTFLVGLFGYLGGHKRVVQALDGIASAAPVARRHGVRLGVVLVGSEVGLDVRDALRQRGLDATATLLAPVDDRTFFAHMAAVDVVVALRYPTLGETSATLLQAMRLGTPVITTDHAQFAEEWAAIRVAPGPDEVEELAKALVVLATSASYRSAAAERSLARARESSLEKATAAYVRVLESAASGARSVSTG
jgi:glycosyltransferase involved in cell wall biosynthesis